MYKVITPPSTEPVSLTEAKTALRLDLTDTSEDILLAIYITAAREYGEDVTSRAFASQTLEALLDSFPASEIELSMPPLQTVTSIKYKDSTGTENTIASSEYIADTDSNIGKIVLAYNKTWPSFTTYPVNPIRIRYTAGYTTDFPKIYKNAMLLHIGYMYKYRDQGVPEEDLRTINNLYNLRRARWFG
jgi:uncharacterized phiE125 gp8 family phage protein